MDWDSIRGARPLRNSRQPRHCRRSRPRKGSSRRLRLCSSHAKARTAADQGQPCPRLSRSRAPASARRTGGVASGLGPLRRKLERPYCWSAVGGPPSPAFPSPAAPQCRPATIRSSGAQPQSHPTLKWCRSFVYQLRFYLPGGPIRVWHGDCGATVIHECAPVSVFTDSDRGSNWILDLDSGFGRRLGGR